MNKKNNIAIGSIILLTAIGAWFTYQSIEEINTPIATPIKIQEPIEEMVVVDIQETETDEVADTESDLNKEDLE